jgi:hypothetical protein
MRFRFGGSAAATQRYRDNLRDELNGAALS